MSCPMKSNLKLRLRSGESGPARRAGVVVAAGRRFFGLDPLRPAFDLHGCPPVSIAVRLLQRERHSHRVKFSWEVDTAHRSKE